MHVITSTPTTRGVSRIESEFELTDQRKWFCPCPHCGEQQTLEWANIKWDKDEEGEHLPETARLVCEKCEKDIDDEQRFAEDAQTGEVTNAATFDPTTPREQ